MVRGLELATKNVKGAEELKPASALATEVAPIRRCASSRGKLEKAQKIPDLQKAMTMTTRDT